MISLRPLAQPNPSEDKMKLFLPTVSFQYPEGSIQVFKSGLARWLEDDEAEFLSSKGHGEIREDTVEPMSIDWDSAKIEENDAGDIGFVATDIETPFFPRKAAVFAIQKWLALEKGAYADEDQLMLIDFRMRSSK